MKQYIQEWCTSTDHEVVLLPSTSCWDTKPFRKWYIRDSLFIVVGSKTCHNGK